MARNSFVDINGLSEAFQGFRRAGICGKCNGWTVLRGDDYAWKIYYKGELIAVGNGANLNFLADIDEYTKRKIEETIQNTYGRYRKVAERRQREIIEIQSDDEKDNDFELSF